MRYEIGDIVTLSFLDYVFVVIKCTEAKGQEPVYDLRDIEDEINGKLMIAIGEKHLQLETPVHFGVLTPEILADCITDLSNQDFARRIMRAYMKADTENLYDILHSYYAKICAEKEG